MAPSEQSEEEQAIDRRIDNAYLRCTGIRLRDQDIPKIIAFARKKITEGVDDGMLGSLMHAYVTKLSSMSSQLSAFLSAVPKLHKWDGVDTWDTGGFDECSLSLLQKFLEEHIPNPARVLETGAGNTTILFLLLNVSRIVSIAPDRDLFSRIGLYCAEAGISDAALDPRIEGSQWALPKLAIAECERFDFAVIDGSHNWPMVFVDFYYVNYLVRPGGYILIDDVHLHSVSELVALLREQWGYEVVLEPGKFIIVRKSIDAQELPDFGGQPYIVRRTAERDAALKGPEARKRTFRAKAYHAIFGTPK